MKKYGVISTELLQQKLPKAPEPAVVEATGVLILLCGTVILALSVIGLKNI